MAKVIRDGPYAFAGISFTIIQDQTVKQQNSYKLHVAGHNIKLDDTHQYYKMSRVPYHIRNLTG
eukprot:10865273-Ditylum_brightwellii.AAC.1